MGDGEEARRGGEARQDKANWRSLAPSGRKSLSAHWFLHLATSSTGHRAKCDLPLFEISLFISIFRAMALAMCVEEEPRYFFAIMRATAI